MTGIDDDGSMRTARSSHDHHGRLWSGLNDRVDAVVQAVNAGRPHAPALAQLMTFVRDDVVAHLEAEQRVLYPAAREIGADLLVDALELDHRAAMNMAAELDQSTTSMQAAMSAHALVTLFGLRMEKEETILLPALERADVDVTALLEGMVVRMATEHDSRFTYF